MNVQSDIHIFPEKKIAIFNILLDLIREYGMAGFSMSILAKRANVSAGTIYHYFDSKDTMMMELFLYVRSKMEIEIGKLLQRKEDSYKQQFISVWINLCKFYLKNDRMMNFMDQFFSSPFCKQVQGEEYRLHENNMSLFFKKGMCEKKLTENNLQVIGTVFFGSMGVTVKKHIMDIYPTSDGGLYTTAEIIWNGLKYREE